MNNNNRSEDDFFRELLSKSKLELPFDDFEDNVMGQIEKEVLHQNDFSKEFRLSRFFFIMGSLFGIILSVLLTQIHEPIFGINPFNLTLLFEIIFASVLFTQIDTLIKFRKWIGSRNENRP